jgi:hypothetical protein
MSDVFDPSNYATGLGQKLRRGLELGPKYFLVDVPRYVRQRKKLGLRLLDLGALWNPVRHFRIVKYVDLPLPPRYAEALAALAAAGVKLDNPPARTEALVSLWWDVRLTPGEVIECGAYRGATSLLLAVLGKLHDVPQKVLMLDTFEGMPETSAYDSMRTSGEFAPPAGWPDVIRGQIAALGVEDRVEVHQGLFADTFASWTDRDLRFAFAHVDANIYQGTLDACEYVLPRMAIRGAVVFDDYNGITDLGARLAIDTVLGDKRPAPLAECSAYLRT